MPKQTEPAVEIQKKQPSESSKPPSGEPSEESRLIAAITYIFGILVAVLIFLLKKEDRYVKYHAAQAIMVDLMVMVVSVVLFIGGFVLMVGFGIVSMGIGFFLGFWVLWLALILFGLCMLAMRLFFAYKAFTGSRFGIPVIGQQAEKIAAG